MQREGSARRERSSLAKPCHDALMTISRCATVAVLLLLVPATSLASNTVEIGTATAAQGQKEVVVPIVMSSDQRFSRS